MIGSSRIDAVMACGLPASVGEVSCAVVPMPLPRSEGRGPAEAVALKFSPDCFRRDLREKDLKPIVLDVIDQAYSARKLLFGDLGLWRSARRFSRRRMLAELFVSA